MQGKDLGLAVVGAGRIGALRARLAADHPSVRYLAIADQDPARARELAQKVGAQFHSGDNAQAMAGPDVDAVIISTSEGEHVAPLLAAIELGKPVLVEKPLALTLAEADEVLRAIARRGADVRVGYSRRYKDRYLIAKEQIVQGRLGRLIGGAARVFNSRAEADGHLERGRTRRDGPELRGLHLWRRHDRQFRGELRVAGKISGARACSAPRGARHRGRDDPRRRSHRSADVQ